MVTAYILIQTEVGKAAQVAKDIVDIKGVQQDAHLSSGAPVELLDHLLVDGRQQQRQQHHWIAAVGSDRLRQGVPARRRIRTALNCGNRV